MKSPSGAQTRELAKLIAIALGCLSLALLGMLLQSKKELGDMKSDLRMAGDMIWSFNATKEEALGGNVSKAVGCLERLSLPPGTIAFSGAGGDFVERERQRAMSDIIAYLRIKTGKDFGESSDRWIDGLSRQNEGE